MFFLLRLISVICIFLAIGHIFLISVSGKRKFPVSGSEWLAISFAVGVGLISLEMLVFSVFGLPWKQLYLIFPWVIIAIFQTRKILFYNRALFNFNSISRPSLWEAIFLGLLALLVIFSLLNNIIFPFMTDDEWGYWGYLAKIFSLEKGITRDIPLVIRNPFLLPLAEGFFSKFIGKFSEGWVKIFSSVFYCGTLVVFYSALKREFSRIFSLGFTFLLASIPNFFGMSILNFADIPLAFYYSSAIFYFYSWLKTKDSRFFILSVIMFIFCLWTKTEAVVYYIIFLIVLMFYLIRQEEMDKNFRYKIALLSLLPFSIFLGWHIYIKNSGLNYLPHVATYGVRLNPKVIFCSLSNLKIVFKYLLEQTLNMKEWHLVWLFLLFSLFLSFKKIKEFPLSYLVLVALLHALSVVLIFMISPFNLTWLVRHSILRLSVVFLPVSVLIIAINMHKMFRKIEIS